MVYSHILTTACMLVFLPFDTSSSYRRGTVEGKGRSLFSHQNRYINGNQRSKTLTKNSSENCLSVKSEERSKTLEN